MNKEKRTVTSSLVEQYPWVFRCDHHIVTPAFTVHVLLVARVLAVLEEGGCWFYGVQPGDVVGRGSTFVKAQHDFQRQMEKILAEIVQGSRTVKTLKAGMLSFFNGVSRLSEEDWEAALQSTAADRAVKGIEWDGDLWRLVSKRERLYLQVELLPTGRGRVFTHYAE